MTVAALFVQRNGVYFGLPDVDPWDEKRDARMYAGPHPVVAHPPCSRWCRLAGLVEARWGHKRGDDGGCFAAALAAVRTWGGVLEHPAHSKAFAAHSLPTPIPGGGWQGTTCGGFVCYVEQGNYGHPAKKATWLYARGVPCLPSLNWSVIPDGASAALVSWCGNRTSAFEKRPRVGKTIASATPPAFRDLLLSIARSARRHHASAKASCISQEDNSMANKQNKEAGASGREDLPTFWPEDVLTLLDEGHLIHGKVNTVRYEQGSPAFQRLVESIREKGVLQPGLVWQFKDSPHPPMVIYGTRRVLALRAANALRVEDGQQPAKMAFKLSVRRSITASEIAAALDLWATENNVREENDWMTIAQGAALQLGAGVPPELVLERWHQIKSRAMLKKITDPAGILSASAALQDALASGEIPLKKALVLAQLPNSQQAARLVEPAPAAATPKRKYMDQGKRSELKHMIAQLGEGESVTLTRAFVSELRQLAELL